MAWQKCSPNCFKRTFQNIDSIERAYSQFHKEFLILPMRSRKSSAILHPKEELHFKKRVEDFINDIDDLCDAFYQNEQHRKKLKKNIGCKLSMNESAWNFRHDQCGPKIEKCCKNILNLI